MKSGMNEFRAGELFTLFLYSPVIVLQCTFLTELFLLFQLLTVLYLQRGFPTFFPPTRLWALSSPWFNTRSWKKSSMQAFNSNTIHFSTCTRSTDDLMKTYCWFTIHSTLQLPESLDSDEKTSTQQLLNRGRQVNPFTVRRLGKSATMNCFICSFPFRRFCWTSTSTACALSCGWK